jgi:hypothetical protein
VAFTSLLERHPRIELVEEAPAWRESRLFRGLEKLLVRPSW